MCRFQRGAAYFFILIIIDQFNRFLMADTNLFLTLTYGKKQVWLSQLSGQRTLAPIFSGKFKCTYQCLIIM